MTNSNILHRGIVSRTGSNDREAYHVGYHRAYLDNLKFSIFSPFSANFEGL